MNLDLSPNEYWQTSAYDYEMALKVQVELNEGKRAGHAAARKEAKQAEDYRRKEEESAKRLEERAGRF